MILSKITLCPIHLHVIISDQTHAAELEWIERAGVVNGGQLRPCDDCTSEEIILPSPFPHGNHSNSSVYVSILNHIACIHNGL